MALRTVTTEADRPGEADAPSDTALDAAAHLHQQLFTGIVLALAAHDGQERAAELVERTFRRQHEERFLAGLRRLGLASLPPALASAQFIVLANRAGGLDVRYAEDGARRAWVRYPPPRWAYEGAAICALDNRVSQAFLRGFHARCGESLACPGLRFVCTGMTTNGNPGLEGYFEDTGRPLAEDERLAFDLGAMPPAYDDAGLTELPWDEARAALARRNYAVRYIQLMLPLSVAVLGRETARKRVRHCAHLLGLQLYRQSAARLEIRGHDTPAFIRYLAAINRATGNRIAHADPAAGILRLAACRFAGDDSFHLWSGLWSGALAMHDRRMTLVEEGGPGWRVE